MVRGIREAYRMHRTQALHCICAPHQCPSTYIIDVGGLRFNVHDPSPTHRTGDLGAGQIRRVVLAGHPV